MGRSNSGEDLEQLLENGRYLLYKVDERGEK